MGLNLTHRKELEDALMRTINSAEILNNVVRQLPVMAARDFKDVKPDVKARIMDEHGGWCMEPKLDGVHFKLHINGTHARLDSRRKSDKTYIYSEKTDNFPHIANIVYPRELDGTIIDGEIMVTKESINTGKTITEGVLSSSCAVANSKPEKAILIQDVNDCWAEFHAFDILFYRGEDVRKETYVQRRIMLKEALATIMMTSPMVGDYIKEVPFQIGVADKEALYAEYLDQGYEGAMLKYNLGGYHKSGTSRSADIYKWKQFYTVDAYVSGWVPANPDNEFAGLIGALELSVIYQGIPMVIAAVQPGELIFRKAISINSGTPDLELRDNIYGKVVEVRFQMLTKKNRGRHAIIERWRPDKGPDQCVIESIKALKVI